MGLIATGVVASAVLIKKNKIVLPTFSDKIGSITPQNVDKEATILEGVSDKTAQAIQQKPEEMAQVLQTSSEKIHIDSTEAIIPKEEAVVEALAEPEIAKTTVIQEETIAKNAAQPEVAETVAAKEEVVAENIAQPETPQAVSAKEGAVVEELAEAEFDGAKETVKRATSRTTVKISKNARKNNTFVKNSMQRYPKLYRDFGVDEDIAESFSQLDNRMVSEFKDDEFLSLLLAPSDSLTVSFNEAMGGIPYRNKLSKTINNTLLRFTRKAKYFRNLDRRLRLNSIVKTVLPTGDRIERLQEMEETFSPQDIQKIFNSDSPKPKNYLLSWLMEFHTKSKDEQLLDQIQRFL